MALNTDLMGLGVQANLASRMGYSTGSLTTTGTAANTAATIAHSFSTLNPQSSQTGAIFSSNMSIAKEYVLFNPNSTTAVIYPPSGATINAAASLNLAQNKTVSVYRYSSTVLVAILTA